MKGITVRPDLRPERWYSTSEVVRALEMSRTSFYRAVVRGLLERRFRPGTLEPLYQGKAVIRFWQQYLKPI